jgi:hypothetical protein
LSFLYFCPIVVKEGELLTLCISMTNSFEGLGTSGKGGLVFEVLPLGCPATHLELMGYPLTYPLELKQGWWGVCAAQSWI